MHEYENRTNYGWIWDGDPFTPLKNASDLVNWSFLIYDKENDYYWSLQPVLQPLTYPLGKCFGYLINLQTTF